MIHPTHRPAPIQRAWPFKESTPARQNLGASVVATPALSGSGVDTPTHVVALWRAAHPELAAYLDALRAVA